jgi:hypothetical protein
MIKRKKNFFIWSLFYLLPQRHREHGGTQRIIHSVRHLDLQSN